MGEQESNLGYQLSAIQSIRYDEDGLAPIHRAVIAGDLPAIKEMVAGGVDVNSRSRNGDSALILAVYTDQGTIAEYLVTVGADPNAVDLDQMGVLHWATRNQSREMVALMIECGVEIDRQNKLGETALLLASVLGEDEIVAILIAKGADVMRSDLSLNTPLHRAAEFSRTGTVEILLKAGANPSAKTAGGESPMHIAARNGSVSIVRMLHLAGASLDIAGPRNARPLHWAVESGHTDVVSYLINAGAAVNARDIRGWNIAHYAVDSAQREALKLAIAAGVDVNARDRNNRTPIELVKSQLGIVDLLREAGASEPRRILSLEVLQVLWLIILLVAFMATLPMKDRRLNTIALVGSVLLYLVYEYLLRTRFSDINIRADLILVWPIIGAAIAINIFRELGDGGHEGPK